MYTHITPKYFIEVLRLVRKIPLTEEEKLTFFIPDFPTAIKQYLEHQLGVTENEYAQLIENNGERFTELCSNLTGKTTAAEAGASYINVIMDILNEREKIAS